MLFVYHYTCFKNIGPLWIVLSFCFDHVLVLFYLLFLFSCILFFSLNFYCQLNVIGKFFFFNVCIFFIFILVCHVHKFNQMVIKLHHDARTSSVVFAQKL